MQGGTMRRGIPFSELRASVQGVENVTTHFQLHNDIVDHL
jgi:hypothetical protein